MLLEFYLHATKSLIFLLHVVGVVVTCTNCLVSILLGTRLRFITLSLGFITEPYFVSEGSKGTFNCLTDSLHCNNYNDLGFRWCMFFHLDFPIICLIWIQNYSKFYVDLGLLEDDQNVSFPSLEALNSLQLVVEGKYHGQMFYCERMANFCKVLSLCFFYPCLCCVCVTV